MSIEAWSRHIYFRILNQFQFLNSNSITGSCSNQQRLVECLGHDVGGAGSCALTQVIPVLIIQILVLGHSSSMLTIQDHYSSKITNCRVHCRPGSLQIFKIISSPLKMTFSRAAIAWICILKMPPL